jgi:2-C-methyl-D-erythritol 4-phosphate cytidylyltransferase
VTRVSPPSVPAVGSVWAIVVAAGSGSRFGGPKQYEPLGDRRVLDWSLAGAASACDRIVLVVPSDRAGDDEPAADVVVAGAATRSGSVRAGLAAVPADAEIVVVHDAARPRASASVWRAVIDAVLDGAAAAVPVVPVADTLRDLGGGAVDRDRLVAVQTPQAFRASMLRRAHEGEPDGTDDASLVEAIGGDVATVDGEPANVKITTADDLEMVAGLFR